MEENKEVTLESVELPEVKNVSDAIDIEDAVIEEEIHDGIDSDEEQELTEEEKRQMLINGLKEFHKMKSNFKSIKQDGNVTTNKYGHSYRKERQKRNKTQRKSRKANRK